MSDLAAPVARLLRIGVVSLLLIAATAFSIAAPVPALACSCGVNPPPEEARVASAAVFTGTLAGERTVDGDGPAADLVARVEVEEVFEGEVNATVDVSTSTDDGLCGIGFATGDRWLFYVGTQKEGGFSTHACTRTAALEYAEADWETSGAAQRDLEVLGASTEPTPGEQLRADDHRSWPSFVAVVVLLLAAAALAVGARWAARRR